MLAEIRDILLLSAKEIFSVSDFSIYAGFSKGYVYRLVADGALPYSKPNGKMIFFKREDVEKYLLQNVAASNLETQKKVTNYLLKTKRG